VLCVFAVVWICTLRWSGVISCRYSLGLFDGGGGKLMVWLMILCDQFAGVSGVSNG